MVKPAGPVLEFIVAGFSEISNQLKELDITLEQRPVIS